MFLGCHTFTQMSNDCENKEYCAPKFHYFLQAGRTWISRIFENEEMFMCYNFTWRNLYLILVTLDKTKHYELFRAKDFILQFIVHVTDDKNCGIKAHNIQMAIKQFINFLEWFSKQLFWWISIYYSNTIHLLLSDFHYSHPSADIFQLLIFSSNFSSSGTHIRFRILFSDFILLT